MRTPMYALGGNNGHFCPASPIRARKVGNVARMDMSRLPRRMLSSWVRNKRPVGRPRLTYRKNSLDSALIIIFWGWAITLNDILIIIFAPDKESKTKLTRVNTLERPTKFGLGRDNRVRHQGAKLPRHRRSYAAIWWERISHASHSDLLASSNPNLELKP